MRQGRRPAARNASRGRWFPAAAVVGALLLGGPLAAGAQAATSARASAAQSTLSVRVDAATAGWLTLRIRAPQGTTAAVTERTAGGAAAQQLAVGGAPVAHRLGTWVCGAKTRRFTVQLTLPTGELVVLERGTVTPGCAHRFTADPGTLLSTRNARIQLRDTFQLGGMTLHACLRGAGHEHCADAEIAPGKSTAVVDLGRPAAGRSTLTVQSGGRTVLDRFVRARRPGGSFRILATGDSMIQIIDGLLADRVKSGGGHVTSDAHISTGISKPWMVNWPQHAAGTAASDHPDVTVVILGANDGFPFGSTACCSEEWSKAYADRAETMMRSYLRGGQGRVVWMLLPTPRGQNFARVFRAVNRALQLAAARFTPEEVTLLDLRRTFTPTGSYRDAITWHGKYVHVRQPDGVHFNVAGARIVSALIAEQLRADGFLR